MTPILEASIVCVAVPDDSTIAVEDEEEAEDEDEDEEEGNDDGDEEEEGGAVVAPECDPTPFKRLNCSKGVNPECT